MSKSGSPWLRTRAKALRKEMTPQEVILWRLLHDGELRALHWRRQFPLGQYILDFVSHPARLVVEVDGAQHGEAEQVEHDRQRTAWLTAQGYQVLRFWNFETKAAQNDIWLTIYAAALKTPARSRIEGWRTENIRQTKQANARLPLDGGGVARAARDGGGVGEELGESPHEAKPQTSRASPPQSPLRGDSSPIEGEQG